MGLTWRVFAEGGTMPPDASHLDSRAKPRAASRRLGSEESSPREQPRTFDENLAFGRSLRDVVSRRAHARWRRSDPKLDPIALLRAGDEGRVPELVPIRYGRMLESPFAFYRGSAAIMAADLGPTPTTGLRVQACGDCHLMNFGGFATPERNVLFDINDFDETLPAPWEWDVKRLVASFVLAARSVGLSEDTGKEAAKICARSYRKHMHEYASMHPLTVWYARITDEDVIQNTPPAQRRQLKARIDKALKQPGSETDFPKLTDVVRGRLTIRDTPPLIYHPAIHRAADFNETVAKFISSYRSTLPPDRQEILDEYYYVDAAIKVVGVGSVGTQCWVVLMMSASNDPLFLQLKQAVASVLEPYAGASAFDHHGERVVVGQRLSQPASDMFLGWVTGPDGNHFYVRQLRDVKIKVLIETFDTDALMSYARNCGWVLARAHAKSGPRGEIAGYLGAGGRFEDAMGEFAAAYADQAERDHAALKAAARKGEITVLTGA
jgi:uncharacterized protein (DUF2252 family)